ncbi:MAG: amino acid ABC transporter ATP-binding protein, partial [Clostridia bacterium]|nr:amino acid ABC transporter ATP-binding protein [Clostridia bacterium]
MINVKQLTKRFGDLKVLDNIDVDIERGDVICVIGPSGAGKSTFLRCLNMLETPTSGHIIFEGDDLMDPKVNLNLHRQRMGMVFQQFNLFPHMTVMDNLTCAPIMLKKEPREKAEA